VLYCYLLLWQHCQFIAACCYGNTASLLLPVVMATLPISFCPSHNATFTACVTMSPIQSRTSCKFQVSLTHFLF
jgi:hypothetical protein